MLGHHVRYRSSTDRDITLKIVDTRTTVETNPGLASNSMAINVELMAVGIELSRIKTLRNSPLTPIREVRTMATSGESTRRNTVESAIGLYVFWTCVCDNCIPKRTMATGIAADPSNEIGFSMNKGILFPV